MAPSRNLVAAVLSAATGLASAASAQEQTILPFDVALTGFVGPQYVHEGEFAVTATGTALLVGGEASVRYGVVSLGLRVGRTTEMSRLASYYPPMDSTYYFRRIEGILGFNIGLGNGQTVLRPFLGVGQSAVITLCDPCAGGGTDFASLGPGATVGLELDHYLTRLLSVGGRVALDTRLENHGDNLGASWMLSAVARISVHWQANL